MDLPAIQMSKAKCHSCGAGLPLHAVLCVACGYHLKTGVHLATASDSTTQLARPESFTDELQRVAAIPLPDSNPYAPPASGEPLEPVEPKGRAHISASKIPEEVYREAWWIAELGISFRVARFAIIATGPACLFVLLLYAVCLARWSRLQRDYPQLLIPNGYYEHDELVERLPGLEERLKSIVFFAIFFGVGWLILLGFMLFSSER
jgi:hypothetical protein